MRYYTMTQFCKVNNFEPKTSADFKRLESAYTLYLKGMANGDSGAYGKAVEIISRRPNSQKLNVAKQGKADASALIDGKLKAVEIKTNGGRIDGVKAEYIVYSMDIHNSMMDMTISKRIMKTADFINALYEMGAVKTVSHKGQVDGLAIQPSKRALWDYLSEQIEYFPEWEYFAEDFGA